MMIGFPVTLVDGLAHPSTAATEAAAQEYRQGQQPSLFHCCCVALSKTLGLCCSQVLTVTKKLLWNATVLLV